MKDLEVVGIDGDVQAAAAHPQGVLEGQARGGFGEGADGVVGHGERVALVGREGLAEILGDEGEEGRAREGRRRRPVGEGEPPGFGDDAAIVLGAERAEIVEGGRGDGRALGPWLGRLVRALRERALEALAVPGDQDVREIMGIVMHVDPAAAQVRLDHKGDPLDVDGGGLGVHAAADPDPEGLGDQPRIGIARGKVGLGEAIQRRLARGLVHGEVVALLKPGLEPELDFLEVGQAQGPDLGLDLLGDGAIPAFDGAAAFARVGLAVAEPDAEVGAGEGELVGAVGRAQVDVEAPGQTPFEDGLFQGVFEGGQLLAPVPLPVRDELGVVVDHRAEMERPEALVGGIPEEGRLVIIANPELVGALEEQSDVALVAEGPQSPAGHPGRGEVAVQRRAAELARDDPPGGLQDVDQGRRRTRRDLAAEGDGRLQQRPVHGLRLPVVLPDLGEQPLQARALVGTPPGPERPDREAPLAPVRGLVGPRGELGQARGALAARQGLDVELADDRVAEQGDLPPAGLGIIGGAGHALRLPRVASTRSIKRRGEARLGEPGQTPEREELVDEEPAEGTRVRRRLGLGPVEHAQGDHHLIGAQHGVGAAARVGPGGRGDRPRQQGRHRPVRREPGDARQRRGRCHQARQPADPEPHGPPRAADALGDRPIRRLRIGEVRERRGLREIRLQAPMRVEPRRPQGPGAPAGRLGTAHPLEREPVRQAMRLAVDQERDQDLAPAIKPDPLAITEDALSGACHASAPGSDLGDIGLELGPRQRDAHGADLRSGSKGRGTHDAPGDYDTRGVAVWRAYRAVC